MTPRAPPLRAALCTGQGCWPGLGQGWGTKVDSGGGGPQPTAYGGAAGDLTSEMDEADGIHNTTFFALIHICFKSLLWIIRDIGTGVVLENWG